MPYLLAETTGRILAVLIALALATAVKSLASVLRTWKSSKHPAPPSHQVTR